MKTDGIARNKTQGDFRPGIRVAIVEDHRLLAELIERYCVGQFDVVSNDQSARSALASLTAHKPDVVLLDMGLPDMEPAALIAAIRQVSPRSKLVALTASASATALHLIQETRVEGYIHKVGDGLKCIAKVIHEVMTGCLSRPDWFRGALAEIRTMPHTFCNVLNERERRVLVLIGRAARDEEIAMRIGISLRVAQSCRARIMRKLGFHSTPELMRYAIAQGFTRYAEAEQPKPQAQAG